MVPTVLILSFFLLSAYFIFGQVSAYMLNAAIQAQTATSATAADLMLSDVENRAVRGRPPASDTIRKVLESRLGALAKLQPISGAIYMEHRRGRVQRVVSVGSMAESPGVGTALPEWMADRYQGHIRISGENYVGGLSSSLPENKGTSVLVVTQLNDVLDVTSKGIGFHIDQVLTSDADETGEGNVFVPSTSSDEEAAEAPAEDARFTFPWWALFSTHAWDASGADVQGFIFVQFGFSPLGLYESIASNALQLGPEGPDLGRLILAALGVLAVLFLVIQVLAIFVGLILARSITGSVHALSQGTEHVRQGDFSYKVRCAPAISSASLRTRSTS